MRSSEDVVYNLTKKSENPNYVFKRLYRNLYNFNLYLQALKNICSKENCLESNEKNINDIIEQVKLERYSPIITKKISQEEFKSNIFKDRIIQEVIRIILNSIYCKEFKNLHLYTGERGFRECILKIKTWKEPTWFIRGYIKSYLYKDNFEMLINILEEKIHDDKFIRLIRKFLKSDYFKNLPLKYNVQKQTINSILFNIYLSKFDKKITQYIQKENTQLNPLEYKGSVQYIRYNNEFLIGVSSDKKIVCNIKKNIENFLLQHLKLNSSEIHIEISNAHKGIEFLSYDIKNIKINTSNRIELFIPKNFVKYYGIKEKLIKNVNNDNWIYKAKYNKIHLNDLEIFLMYKKQKDMLYNYYFAAQNTFKIMSKVDYMLKISCFKTIAHKHRKPHKYIMQKYRINSKDFGMEFIKNGKITLIRWNTPLFVNCVYK